MITQPLWTLVEPSLLGRVFSAISAPQATPAPQALMSVAPALVIAFRGFLFLVRAEDAQAILR
jgi:hypothetical protein